METISNIRDLRKSLTDNYSKLKSKKMQLATGKELANTAGKILKSVAIEMEYQNLTGEKKPIEFLQ